MSYNQDQLRAAFEMVADKVDWRKPIDSTLEVGSDAVATMVPLIRAAVIHFTATDPTITRLSPDCIRVEADGYRAGPAGP
jgi:hypothetical protein